MLSLNDKISVRQFQILLILDVFGTGAIVLPRRAASYAAQDGWLVVAVAIFVAMVYSYIIGSLARLFPEDNFVRYTGKIVGKPLGLLISAGFVLKILLNVSLELRFFCEIVKQVLLFHTPFFVVCLAMILAGAYAAAKGYETRARIAEILIFIVFIPLIFVLCIGAVDVDFTNLLPVLAANPLDVLRGGFFTAFTFTGLEFALLAYPYLQRPKRARGGAVLAIFCLGLVLTAITVITLAKFGPFDIQRQIWPVLELMDIIDLPGSFIERQDALVMSLWIVAVFAIVNASIFFLSILLKDIVKKGKHFHYILIGIPFILLIAYLPANITQVFEMMNLLYLTFGIAYMLVIPLALLIIAKIRGLGMRYEKDSL